MAFSPSHPAVAAAERASTPHALRALAALAALAAPALVDPDALQRASESWRLAENAQPYWPGERVLESWLWTPLVALGACTLFLAPGLAIAAACGAATGLGRWLMCALAASLTSVSALACALGLWAPQLGRGAPFGWCVAAFAALAWSGVVLRAARGAPLPWPPRLASALAPTLVVPFVLFALLGPKFHWESFNGDGVHAFESIRLLLVQPVPFWSESAGNIRGFPGPTSMLFAFPGAWFVRLLGENEGAARVSIALYLAGVFGAIAALVEHARGVLRASEAWLIWGGLALYLLVMAFSASYDPYSADIALPATQDTLLVACVLAAVVASLRGERAWTALFTVLSYTSLPSGLMLLGLWLVAAWLCVRPRPTVGLVALGVALVTCVAATRVAPVLLDAFGLPQPGGEYESLLSRFAYLQVADVRRTLFALVPCGLFPGLALLAWRRFDGVSRALALMSLGYFACFYVQAYISLHQFVPAMLLPLAAFWRSGFVAAPASARGARLLTVAGLALCLWLSWPTSWTPLVHARRIGERLHAHVEGYQLSAPASLAAASALRHLFPSGFSPQVPDELYGGSPYIWNRYAQRAGGEPAPTADYWLAPEQLEPPPGAKRVGLESGFALYVRDVDKWRVDAHKQLPNPPGAELYAIDRGRLFSGAKTRSEGPAIYDLRALRERWMRR
ncbi:MAG: hypothetical protein FJ294_13760 [Planctomycetes bacterium]|nr:hypothetical protein [Planctomycetota bacterium]